MVIPKNKLIFKIMNGAMVEFTFNNYVFHLKFGLKFRDVIIKIFF